MTPKPKTIAFIFARGGSKGLPRKALRILAGKPLIVHSIQSAQQCTLIDRVIVSTDDEEIAALAKRAGAETPFLRPRSLARDDTPERLAWKHAVEFLITREGRNALEVFVSLPSTAPLRSTEDISRCIELFQRGDVDLIVTATPAHHNPYFNMIRVESNGYAVPVINDGKTFSRRQEAPETFDLTTVCYVTSPHAILTQSSLWEGRIKAVIIPQERAVDIDSELDLAWAEFLWQKNRTQRAA